MREARAAKVAAESERREKAKAARAERAAAAAAAAKAAAEAEADQAAAAAAAKAGAAGQEVLNTDGANMLQHMGLNGYAQQAQRAAGTLRVQNGRHMAQTPASEHHGKYADDGQAQAVTAGEDPEVDIMYNTPEKAAAATAAGGGGSGPSPDVDIIHSPSSAGLFRSRHPRDNHQLTGRQSLTLQDDVEVDITHVSPFAQHAGQSARQQLRSQSGADYVRVSIASDSTQHQHEAHSEDGMGDHSGQTDEQQKAVPVSEHDFDWAAWQLPEEGSRGAALPSHLVTPWLSVIPNCET